MTIKLGKFYLELIDDTKPARKQPVRRTNGQVARKIPVTYYGKVVDYIYR